MKKKMERNNNKNSREHETVISLARAKYKKRGGGDRKKNTSTSVWKIEIVFVSLSLWQSFPPAHIYTSGKKGREGIRNF